MQQRFETIVIGAGQAGLAAGYHLQRAGADFTILEAGQQSAGSWPRYYESLRLFSPARFSSLPGLPFPGDPERYPARDEVVDYLNRYAAHFHLPVTLETRVETIRCNEEWFTLTCAEGSTFQARSVIAASGAFHRPHLPTLPGQEQFAGAVMHSVAYREPTALVGKRVVVVGAGNSAIQIAIELAQVADVTLATRQPIRFVQQRPYGRDLHFWWWLTGFDRVPFDTPLGAWLDRLAEGKGARVLDTGVYQAAIAAGKPHHRPIFTRFTEQGVVWADGSEETIDAVIFATGYRPNLPYLAALGALDASGYPLHRQGVSLSVAGLYYVGLAKQRNLASATLRGVGADARVVVRHLLHDLQPAASSGSMDRALRCCPTLATGR